MGTNLPPRLIELRDALGPYWIPYPNTLSDAERDFAKEMEKPDYGYNEIGEIFLNDPKVPSDQTILNFAMSVQDYIARNIEKIIGMTQSEGAKTRFVKLFDVLEDIHPSGPSVQTQNNISDHTKFTPEIIPYSRGSGIMSGITNAIAAASSSSELTNKKDDDDVVKCLLPEPASQISFENIAGQKSTKQDIETNYIYPLKFPGLFKEKSKGVLFYGPPGTGKCLGPDVEVMMYDGTFKKACNIRPYDVLMGDDSTPRQVYSITTGVDDMYNIIPTDGYGEPFTVNEPHIMSLLKESEPILETISHGYKVMWYEDGRPNFRFFKGTDISTKTTAEYFYNTRKYVYDVEDIALGDYLNMRKPDRKKYNGYRVGVEWDEQPTPINPFEFGKSLHLTTGNIPKEYILNSKQNRIDLLAGYLSGCGYDILATSAKYNIKSENIGLISQLSFIARSVGLNARMRSKDKLTIHTTKMCSALSLLSHSRPERSYPNTFSFKVSYIGKGRYFGFTIGGNRRFLLKDFTVTHNTLLAKAATKQIEGAAFFAPTAGELKGKYSGDDEKQIRALFRCAGEIVGKYNDTICNTVKTSIIFVDEAEALVGDRKKYGEGMTRTTNTFLQCMDGLKSYPDVSVIAATNYPWDIDSAIERRFSEKIFVDKPDVDAIEWLVKDSLKRLFLPPGLTQDEYNLYKNRTDKEKFGINDINRVYSIMSEYKTSNYCETRKVPRKGKEKTGKRRQPDMAYTIAAVTDFTGLRTVKEEQKLGISEEFINYVVDKMKHSAKMEELITKIKNGEQVTDADLENRSEIRVGYSGSDVTKVMSIAAKLCSSESMEGVFHKRKFWVRYLIYDVSSESVMKEIGTQSPITYDNIASHYGYTGNTKSVFIHLNGVTLQSNVIGNVTLIDTGSKRGCDEIKSERREYWKDEEFYVHFPLNKIARNMQYYYIPGVEMNKEVKRALTGASISTLHEVPADKYDMCISFSLCPGHIRLAIRKYPPTIQLKPYLNLLRYKYQGIDAVLHDEE